MSSPEFLPLPRRGEKIAPEFFRSIAESTVDWESWFSVTGEVLWVNEAVRRFTGISPEECLKMDDYPMQLIAADDRSRIAALLREAVSGSTENNVEFRILHRDGSTRWVAVSWQPMKDDNGRSLGYRTSVRDVTEKRHMREQLRLQNEHLEQIVQERTAKIAQLEKHRLKMEKLAALGELAAGVAHEINNPLAGIRNVFELLKRQLPTDVKHYDKLSLIDAEIERISGITHQMYQLYRPSQQRSTVFSVRKTIDEVLALTVPMSRKSSVGVKVNYVTMERAPDLSKEEVVLREGELKQILLNLIHNAIQASPRGNNVQIEVHNSRDQLSISVHDQGCGISEENLDKVFDPFFSTKAAKVGQGMGLGLSVTKGLIEAMQGTITVSSKLGIGTEFKLRLPRNLQLKSEA
ncbi:ATP-binding protein [Roseiconus lacunae]|uniref:two-component system sensor histidine kinase NtrB n=1 Tax=Roseiconus lacunae TaxID=2605694 RepID=UPI00308DC2FC|nr:ATP-binding protein [Stieleria sp. HD01]